MAAAGVVAIRYAHAFSSVAMSAKLDIAAAQQQMQQFASLLDGNHDLREVLENPSIPAEQKLAVLDGLAERLGMMRAVRNFIAVIMDHQRLNELNEIIAEYDRVADVDSGVTDAEVTSAFALNDEDRQGLEQQVAKLAGSKVRIAYSQDSTLLGGAIVRIGSTVYDGSVRGQFEQMRQTLLQV